MIQIKMLPDWSILNYPNRRRPDVPEHDFLKIFGEFWVFWNSKILIILRLKFFHSGTSDSVMNKMTSNDSRMTQIWPKIDILMTLSQFHFKMVRWLNGTGYRRNRIDEICSNETHSLIHWYNDLLNIPFFLLKSSQKGLSDRTSYHLAVFYEDGTAKACTESYFLVYFWDSYGQKYPIYPQMTIIEILKSRPSAICIVTFLYLSS